jgi:hypothetical protein
MSVAFEVNPAAVRRPVDGDRSLAATRLPGSSGSRRRMPEAETVWTVDLPTAKIGAIRVEAGPIATPRLPREWVILCLAVDGRLLFERGGRAPSEIVGPSQAVLTTASAAVRLIATARQELVYCALRRDDLERLHGDTVFPAGTCAIVLRRGLPALKRLHAIGESAQQIARLLAHNPVPDFAQAVCLTLAAHVSEMLIATVCDSGEDVSAARNLLASAG